MFIKYYPNNETPTFNSGLTVKFESCTSQCLNPRKYAGHSLRSGFITSAAIYQARLDEIMEVSRHKSTDMVMSYICDNNVFEHHAGFL